MKVGVHQGSVLSPLLFASFKFQVQVCLLTLLNKQKKNR